MPSRPRPSASGGGGGSSSAPNPNATPLGSSSSTRFSDAHTPRTNSSSSGGGGGGPRGGFQTLPGHIANQRKNAYRGKGGKLVIAGGGGGMGKGAYLGKGERKEEKRRNEPSLVIIVREVTDDLPFFAARYNVCSTVSASRTSLLL